MRLNGRDNFMSTGTSTDCSVGLITLRPARGLMYTPKVFDDSVKMSVRSAAKFDIAYGTTF